MNIKRNGKMKASRLAAMLLLAVAMCMNFAACSDDGPEVPASITGTTWEGVDEYGYRMVVEVETSTGGEFSVYEPETNRLYYRMDFTYLFSRESGEVIVQLDYDVLTGQIDGDVLTIDYYGTTLTFDKR